MADEINIVVKAEDAFSSVLGNFGNVMTGIKSTIDLVGMAFDGARDLLQPFIDSASESELALVGLENVMKSTGATTGMTEQQLLDLSSALQGVTRYSDEQIQSAEAMLLRFENLNPIMEDATKLTLDYAASLGIDLTSAAQTIGKALDDPASGIGRLNTQFKLFNQEEMDAIKNMAEAGDVAGAQALIMDRLREKVGGAAEAFGNTFAGQLDIAGNKIDDLRERIGGALLPILNNVLDWFTTFIDSPGVKLFVDNLSYAISSGDWSKMDLLGTHIIDGITKGLYGWINSGGPEELVNQIVSFVDNIGEGDDFDSKTLEAAKRLITALGDAIESVDWGTIGIHIDAKIGLIISEQDWTSSGAAVGDAIEKFITEGWTKGTNQAATNIKSSALGALGDAIKDFFIGAIGGQQAADYWASAWENLIDHAKSLARFGFDDVGRLIVEGLKDGVNWAWGNFKALFNFGFDDILNFIKAKLGISSPSTVFADISRNLVLGLMQGWIGLFTTFKSLISSGIDEVLKLFAPFLALFGVDVSSSSVGGTSGSFGGFGGTTTTTGSTTSTKEVKNYFYGPVYFQGAGEPGSYYDCPSPNPFMTATDGNLSTSGI